MAGLAVGAIAFASSDTADAVPGVNVVRLVLGTLLVVGILLGAARLLPRLGAAAGISSENFCVVSSLAVGQRERVVVIQVGGRQLMLGVAPGRVEKLHELDEPLGPAGGTRSAAVQAAPAWLSRVLGGQS